MSVYKRGKWWWMCGRGFIPYRQPTGIPVEGRKNEQLAMAVYSKKLVQLAEGKGLDVKKECKLTIEEFSKTYIKRHAMVEMKRCDNEQSLINAINLSSVGKIPLSELTKENIYTFRTDALEKPICKKIWKLSTANRHVQCIQRMLNKAEEWGYVSTNPIAKIKHFSEKEFKRDRILSSEEQDRLFEGIETLRYECAKRRLRDCVLVYLNTGLRKNELMNCKWTDIDFDLGVIKVVRRKNDKPLFAPMNEITRYVMARRKAHRRGDQYVFQSPDGVRPYNPKTAFERALKAAKIKDFKLHDLRHTFASNLAMRGVNQGAIQSLLGHDDSRSTDRYIKYNPASLLSAVKEIESITVTNLSQTTKEARDAEFRSIIKGAV